jgi:single-stranded-DNA-specific exonuclease
LNRVLAVRGFAPDDAPDGAREQDEVRRDYLAPQYSDLYSPLLFKQMPLAVSRILKAREAGERVAIIGDYDADGITAAALLYKVFIALAMPPPLVLLPHRLHDGYGLTPDLVTRAIDQGASLLITVDTGISGVEAGRLAQERGVDLIITDHHQVIGEIPPCHALINPWAPGETYPFRELAGVGVAYKLAAAVLARVLTPAETERFLKWTFDLVAIGTIADLVPLVGENRIFAYHGLGVIEKPRSLGLKALLRICNLTPPFDTETVSYRLAPRINAAGRIAEPQTALDLLLEEDEEKCLYLARELDRLNGTRQAFVRDAMKEIDKSIPARAHEDGILIVKNSSWPQGIVGLIAGKLSERTLLSVIAMSNNHDPNVYVASCRFRPGLDATEFIDHFREMFFRGGGHTAAGGFSMGSDKIALFEERARSWASERWSACNQDTPLMVDLALSGADCTCENARELQKLAPFGMGNPEPIFTLSGVRVENVRMLGDQRQHRQMRIRTQDQNFLDTITFNMPPGVPAFRAGDVVSLAASLRINSYNNVRRIQLLLHDVHPGISEGL